MPLLTDTWLNPAILVARGRSASPWRQYLTPMRYREVEDVGWPLNTASIAA
jgi:hypothetical protein